MSRKEQQQQTGVKSKQSLTHTMKLFSLKCLIIALVATAAAFACIQFASSSQGEQAENPKKHCQQAKEAIANWKRNAAAGGRAPGPSAAGSAIDDDDVPAHQTSVKSHPRNLRVKFAIIRELAYTILYKRCKIFEPTVVNGRKVDTGLSEGMTFEDTIAQTVSLASELANMVDELDIELPDKFVYFMENFIYGIGDEHMFEKINV